MGRFIKSEMDIEEKAHNIFDKIDKYLTKDNNFLDGSNIDGRQGYNEYKDIYTIIMYYKFNVPEAYEIKLSSKAKNFIYLLEKNDINTFIYCEENEPEDNMIKLTVKVYKEDQGGKF